MIAALRCAPHGVACLDTAIGLWTGDDHRPAIPQIVVPPSKGHRPRGIEVHRSATLLDRDVALVRGIPTTGLPRTLLDLAASRSLDELERLVNRCRRTNALPVGALVDVAERHRGRGRAGCRSLLSAVARCHPTVPDSDFETMALQAIRNAGLADPTHHHIVETDAGVFELDAFWDGPDVDLELDGRQHLTDPQVLADNRRDRALQHQGITVTRWPWLDYVVDPMAMVADLIALGVPRR